MNRQEMGSINKENNTTLPLKETWEDFWAHHQEINKVYSNADRIVRQLRDNCQLKDKLILEIGAGSGRDGLTLIDSGATLVFLDYAENALRIINKIAKEENKPALLIKGDIFHLPIKNNVIDLVFHQGLLEHFKHPEDILAENNRVLNQHGFAMADVPQRYHPYTVVKHILIWLNKWFAGWETEFSKKELERLFRETGFNIYHKYGSWMYPSFAYRVIREIIKKLKIHLPLYPPKIPILSGWRRKLREHFRNSKWAYYTFMDIGMIGSKKNNTIRNV